MNPFKHIQEFLKLFKGLLFPFLYLLNRKNIDYEHEQLFFLIIFLKNHPYAINYESTHQFQ